MNNNFRPISLSEGFISEKKDTLLRKFSKNDLTDIYVKTEEDYINKPNNEENKNIFDTNFNTELQKNTRPFYIDDMSASSNNNLHKYNYHRLINSVEFNDEQQKKYVENEVSVVTWNTRIFGVGMYCLKKITPSKNTLVYFLKKIFMFMFHLSLISIFEIIFFFTIVSVYENNAITDIVIDFFDKVPNTCNNMTLIQKEYFTSIFDSIINITEVDNNANKSYIDRKHFNNKLYVNAWMYFLIIIGIDIILLLIKFHYKIKINYKKIILENIVMISILAVYEYMFFKSIILFYQNISRDELIKSIIGEFDTCLVPYLKST